MRPTSHRRGRIAAVLAATAVAAGLLTGCAGGAEADDITTISFLSWENEATMTPLIERFEELNPDVRVEFSWAPPVADYIQALQTRLSAGNAPDVFIITAENRTQLMEAGAVKDLSGADFLSNVAPAALVPYSDADGVYGVAINSWGGGILFNADILGEAGIQTPFATWDDFVDAGRTLQEMGITAYLDSLQEIPVMLSAMIGQQNVAHGGDMDEQIFAGDLTFEEAWTPALERYIQLVDAGILDRAAAGITNDQVMQEFQAGRIAMMSTGSWQPGNVRSGAPDMDFAFTAVPGANPGESYWTGAVAPGLAISADSGAAEQAAALRFLEFWQSPESVEHMNTTTGSITTTADFEPTVDPSLVEMADDLRAGRFYLPMSFWPRHQDALQTKAVAQIQLMISGELSPREAAAGLDAELARLGG